MSGFTHETARIDGREYVVYRHPDGTPFEVTVWREATRRASRRRLVRVWRPLDGEPKGIAAQAIAATAKARV